MIQLFFGSKVITINALHPHNPPLKQEGRERRWKWKRGKKKERGDREKSQI
jgi:hypothetical protein